MRANHATPELKDLVNRQAEAFNENVPEDERVRIYRAIQEYQDEHKGDES